MDEQLQNKLKSQGTQVSERMINGSALYAKTTTKNNPISEPKEYTTEDSVTIGQQQKKNKDTQTPEKEVRVPGHGMLETRRIIKRKAKTQEKEHKTSYVMKRHVREMTKQLDRSEERRR